MARSVKSDDGFRDRLLKLIPSEIVAGYLFLQGVVPVEETAALFVIVGVLFILTPLYMLKFQGVTRFLQLAATSASFLVWVFSIGGPFKDLGFYEGWLGAVVLVLWTLSMPLFVRQE